MVDNCRKREDILANNVRMDYNYFWYILHICYFTPRFKHECMTAIIHLFLTDIINSTKCFDTPTVIDTGPINFNIPLHNLLYM